MRTNIKNTVPAFTHEGARSSNVSNLQKLKRLTMACMLWEDTFYVDGKTITDQIIEVCSQLDGNKIVEVALDTHKKGLLRHIPLFLILQAIKRGAKCSQAIYEICTRPDQMTELLSLYWKDGRKSIAAQLKKGLALAFTRFDEYQLAKYNRDNPIKLKDILFMCHAKPVDQKQTELWKRLIAGELKTPDTWETRLSAGEDKKQSFKELLELGKMGKLAILRNLRNMNESGVNKDLVAKELIKKGRPLLPFQFISAAKHCPQWEDIIDTAMVSSCQEREKLPGMSMIMVDVSGSMNSPVSANSEISLMDAACAISILLREICESFEFLTFSDQLAVVPPRQGMALRDAIVNSQPRSGTYLRPALEYINLKRRKDFKIDRLIIITDEQTADEPLKMMIDKCYIINIAPYKNGLKNVNNWLTVTGFSEHVIDYIVESEKESCKSFFE